MDLLRSEPLETSDKWLAPSLMVKQWALGGAIVAVTALVMSGSVWLVKKEALRRFERNLAQARDAAQTAALKNIDGLLESLKTFSKSLSDMPKVSHDEFKDRAAAYLPQNSLLSSLNLVNMEYRVTEVYPFINNRTALGQDLKSRFDVLPAAHQAVADHVVVPTGRVDLLQGGQGIIFYAPLWNQESWLGLVEAVVKNDALPRLAADPALLKNYELSILDQSTGQELYQQGAPAPSAGPTTFDTYFSVQVGPRTWWVILQPKKFPFVLLPLMVILLLELAAGAFLFHKWIVKNPHRP